MGRKYSYRSSRFLIDKIDAKLGDVNKEIKFDKIVIFVALGIIAVEVIALLLSGFSFFRILAIIGAFFAAASLFIIPVMIQELRDDKEKAKAMNEQAASN